MLDTLLEVMDLTQLDASEQHAARADVVVTPRFGPGSWRDFHLADLFLDAGRRAAEEQLTSSAPPSGAATNPRGGASVSSREFTFEDVRDILVNRVGVPEERVTDDPALSFEDMGLDSLAFVEIQLAMQQEYGFTIPDEDAEQICDDRRGDRVHEPPPRRAGRLSRWPQRTTPSSSTRRSTSSGSE